MLVFAPFAVATLALVIGASVYICRDWPRLLEDEKPPVAAAGRRRLAERGDDWFMGF